MELVWPARPYLASYMAALERGWSPNNLRPEVAQEELEHIADDPDDFLASLSERDVTDRWITLPDGTRVPKLPGHRRWMWDGEFCGSVGLRWQPGTEALPEHCLGHIGYSVVPWKQRRGYATQALRDMLPDARLEGLRYVDLTTRPDNVGSRRVIEANGGVLIEEFVKHAGYGGGVELRYRIFL